MERKMREKVLVGKILGEDLGGNGECFRKNFKQFARQDREKVIC